MKQLATLLALTLTMALTCPAAGAADPPAVTDLAWQLRQCALDSLAEAKATSKAPGGEKAGEVLMADFTYPRRVDLGGEQGALVAVSLVDPLGNPRYAHVLAMTASGEEQAFVDTAMQDLRAAHYEPTQVAKVPTARWRTLRLVYEMPRISNVQPSLWNFDYIASTRSQAQSGNVSAMAAASYVDLLGAPLLKPSPRDDETRYRYLAYAALAGDAVSLLRAHVILRTGRCSRGAEFDSAFAALARKGNPWVALSLADRLLEVPGDEPRAQALELLRQVARGGNSAARAMAIGLLATHPDDSLRDPALALEQARAMDAGRNPDSLEAQAAAYAAGGDFKSAVATEEQAIMYAQRLEWRTARLADRLQAYRAGVPWRNLLCDCEHFAP